MSKKNAVLIIPTYNSVGTLEETLVSILAQGPALKRLARVIISDDGSRDETVALARRLWTSSTPLEILRAPKNRGEYLNVNSAVCSLEPSIEWYLMMHSDNLAKQGWIEALLDNAKTAGPKVGSICTSYDIRALDGRITPGPTEASIATKVIEGGPGSVYGTLKNGCWWHNSTAAVRVKAFKDIGGMPAKQGMSQKGDWDFLIRLLARDWSILYVPRALVVYCDNVQSVSSANFRKHVDISDALGIIERYCGGCPKEFLSMMYRNMTKWLIQRFVAGFFRFQWVRAALALKLIPTVVRSYYKTLSLRKSPLMVNSAVTLVDPATYADTPPRAARRRATS